MKINKIREIVEKIIILFVIISSILWIAAFFTAFIKWKLFISLLLTVFFTFTFSVVLLFIWKLIIIIEEKENKE